MPMTVTIETRRRRLDYREVIFALPSHDLEVPRPFAKVGIARPD
jgi:hypothetical protein